MTNAFDVPPQISRRRLLVGAGAAAAASALPGCGDTRGESETTLKIAMYGDLAQKAFMDNVAKPFARAQGIKLQETSYGDQNQMLATVKSNPGAYDIVICSDFAIFDGIKQGLLEKIDIKNVPNYKNLAERYQHPQSDPGPDVHNVPIYPTVYLMVSPKGTGPTNPTDYSPLYDTKYKGKIALRDYGAYRILQTALALGYDVNKLTKRQETAIFARLSEQRNLVKTFWATEAQVRTLLGNKDVALADYWLQNTILGKDLSLESWVPTEGVPAWLSGLSIPKGSKNKEAAEKLFNHMLSPNIYMKYATAGKFIPTIKSDLYDEKQFAKDAPGVQRYIEPVAKHGVYLDLNVWDEKKADWTERYEQIKLGG